MQEGFGYQEYSKPVNDAEYRSDLEEVADIRRRFSIVLSKLQDQLMPKSKNAEIVRPEEYPDDFKKVLTLLAPYQNVEVKTATLGKYSWPFGTSIPEELVLRKPLSNGKDLKRTFTGNDLHTPETFLEQLEEFASAK